MSDAFAQPNLVSKLALALQRGNPLEDMVRPLLEMLHLTTGLESTYLTRIDAQGGRQCVLFALNRGALDISEGLEVDWNDTLCKRAIDEGRTLSNDVASHWSDSQAARALGIQSFASVPVHASDGAPFGTLCAAGRGNVEHPAATVQLLQVFSHLIGQQIERDQLVQDLREATTLLAASALTDALTGLPNRRALIDALRQRLPRSGDIRTLVAFIDLDGFKAINDAHGHDAGDHFLIAMARALSGTVPATDLCARLGGDEFVCLIDVTLADDADAGAIWRARLEAATRGRFDLGGQVIVDYPGASVGLVTVEPDDDNPDTVLDRADSAMYAVKRSRRSGQPLSSPVQKARFRTG